MAKLNLARDGRFISEDYNQARFFASFFPGIAGKKAIPTWAYFVNRGQCLAGFGFANKDGALQEFVPADKAAWYATCRGFRTFLKIRRDGREYFYEPFQIGNPLKWQISNRLTIEAAELTINEWNHDLGVEVQVTFFCLPEEPFGGLYRKTTIINHGSELLDIQVLDGLAVMLPAGYNDFWAKNMGATIRAWMTVNQVAEIPVYKLKYRADDVTELIPVSHAHFFFGYTVRDGRVEQLPAIYDPAAVFGWGTDFDPVRFKAPEFRYPQDQSDGNNLGSAFSFLEAAIRPEAQLDLWGLYGRVEAVSRLPEIKNQIDPEYYERHREQNRRLVQEVKDYAWVRSGVPQFDQYLGQSFLDNVLRGGLPVTLNPHSRHSKVFWLYSRKHGDLERDYNDFQLSPTYYSQGNGNFRDINQNRRNDVWFNADVGDSVLHYFWDLIQLDGYNPLVVKGLAYQIGDGMLLRTIFKQHRVTPEEQAEIRRCVTRPFTPGELSQCLTELPAGQNDCLFTAIIEHATEIEQAEYREGYWIDHWTYNLDLFESWLAIYPDRLTKLACERNDYTFFDSPAYLAPLAERFYLEQNRVVARNAVRIDSDKLEEINGRRHCPNLVRIQHGEGNIYHTNLLVKMLILALNKLASFDPALTGLEMDAGRPGWCDAVNGLPGLLGSSVPEVFALKRLLQQMQLIVTGSPGPLTLQLPSEVAAFLNRLDNCLEMAHNSDAERLQLWQATHQCREDYLREIRTGLNGTQLPYPGSQLLRFLTKAESLVTEATQRAYQPEQQIYHTYYYYRVTRWQELPSQTDPNQQEYTGIRVRPETFEQCILPPFLEGQVAALRSATQLEVARQLYQAVRRSDLHDARLEMYKVCADLSNAPDELGRIRVFRRGWLENESVFLHMEYKYLLEILRNGLNEEFFAELPKLLVCFFDPNVYGRNPLENSSFIVSSAYPDAAWHGNGFVARLSGSTAEMLNIWLWISFGRCPFQVNEAGELELEFRPVLSPEFFSQEERCVTIAGENRSVQEDYLPAHTYAARFLGRTLVVYHNPGRRPTYGLEAAQIKMVVLTAGDGQKLTIPGSKISGQLAEQVRQGLITKIEVELQ